MFLLLQVDCMSFHTSFTKKQKLTTIRLKKIKKLCLKIKYVRSSWWCMLQNNQDGFLQCKNYDHSNVNARDSEQIVLAMITLRPITQQPRMIERCCTVRQARVSPFTRLACAERLDGKVALTYFYSFLARSNGSRNAVL